MHPDAFLELSAPECELYFLGPADVMPVQSVYPLAQNYRNWLDYIYGANNPFKIKSCFISLDEIKDLVNQDPANIKGIKVYMTHEKITTGAGSLNQLRLFLVGADERYNDYGVPAYSDVAVSSAGTVITGINPGVTVGKIFEARPCPVSCGLDNILNSNPTP